MGDHHVSGENCVATPSFGEAGGGYGNRRNSRCPSVLPGRRRKRVGFEMDLFVFDRAPEPIDENVVYEAPAPGLGRH